MKKTKHQKTFVFKKTILVFFFICFSLVSSTAFAADKWFYWVNSPVEEQGILGGKTGFNTKKECEEDSGYKTVSPDRLKSNGCYLGGDVKITSFSPESGTTGDMITITGENIVGMDIKVFFGSIEAIAYSQGENTTKILARVPQGVSTSKITVVTPFRGTAVSAKSFTFVAGAPNTNPWWFLNTQKQYMGPYATLSECKLGYAQYIASNNVSNWSSECSQHTQAEATQSQQITGIGPNSLALQAQEDTSLKTSYNLLAPIGELKCIDTNTANPAPGCEKGGIGDYLNIIFKIAIGLAGALAVIMIIISSVQYMGDESVFGKTEAKGKILSAIFGLLIALGAYALLNTISPELTGAGGVTVDQVSAEIIDLPDAGDDTVDPDFAKKDYKYSTDAAVSPGVTAVVTKLKQGWEIDYFKVYTNERMLIALKRGTERNTENVIDVRSGVNGFSEPGQAKGGDKKTPKGTWRILQIRTSKDGKPVYNKKGSNMGATFWLLSPMTGGERGIGMHGNKNGTLGRTSGCIRLKNSDLLALLPFVKVGTPMIVGS
jgi:lipoprotein-anchoring transpeptidase ErfK/SrfK